MGRSHGIALGSGCQYLHCSDSPRVMLEISVVKSLPEFCGQAISPDMEVQRLPQNKDPKNHPVELYYHYVLYGKGQHGPVKVLWEVRQDEHGCAVQALLHVRHYHGEEKDEAHQPRPDQWGTLGGPHVLVKEKEPGQVGMDGTEFVRLRVEIYQVKTGDHLQPLQREDLQSQHLLLQHVCVRTSQ